MLYKKIIGSFVLLTCLIGATFTVQSFADAKNGQSSDYQLNGTLETKTASSITIISVEGSKIKINIDEDTVFVGKLDLADIAVGDRLKVNVREENSVITAKTIKKTQDGCGYGNDEEGYTLHLSTSAKKG